MRAGPLICVVLLLLTACTGAPQSSPSPATPAPSPPSPTSTAVASSPTPTGPASPSPAADGWRELLTGAWLGEDPFAVAAATSQAQLDELWRELGQDPPAPPVDFGSEMVLFLGTSGSSTCPERLERLVVDFEAGRVHGGWAAPDPGQPCTDDLQAQGVLIAVDRALLPEQPFLLSLREQPICPDCPEQPDQLIVDPAG